MRTWSHQLLSILCVNVHRVPVAALPARCMLVSNHISWIDIFVLASQYPAIFVAKSEIRSWPLVGALCSRAGTVFIERGRRSSAKRTNALLGAAIARGALITLFPEGTTTDGYDVAPFHAALFQPAIEAGAEVQPALIRYIDIDERYCDGPNFVGDTTFLQSLWHITRERHLIAQVELLETVSAAGRDRRALASTVRSAIRNRLISRAGTAPDIRAYRPASPQ